MFKQVKRFQISKTKVAKAHERNEHPKKRSHVSKRKNERHPKALVCLENEDGADWTEHLAEEARGKAWNIYQYIFIYIQNYRDVPEGSLEVLSSSNAR